MSISSTSQTAVGQTATGEPPAGSELPAGLLAYRPYAYATVYSHPPTEGAAFGRDGHIRPEIPADIAQFCKNESNCMFRLPGGTLAMTWGMGSYELARDERIVMSTSDDDGRTWSQPRTIVRSDSGLRIAYGVPHYDAQHDALYLIYHAGLQTDRADPSYDSGHLWWVRSPDRGATWSSPTPIELPDRDLDVFPDRLHAWLNHPPTTLASGRVLLPFSRITTNGLRRRSWTMAASETRVLELTFDADGMTTRELPDGPTGIRADRLTHHNNPAARRLATHFGGDPLDVAGNFQELTLAELPDGRLLGVGRTVLGSPGFSVSRDSGTSWTAVEQLRYSPGGRPIEHPMTMCPVLRLRNGDVVLMFTNNDGSRRGSSHVWDGQRNRNPQWLTVGHQQSGVDENAGLTFSDPIRVAEVIVGPDANMKTGISMPHALETEDGLFVAYNVNKEHIVLDRLTHGDLGA